MNTEKQWSEMTWQEKREKRFNKWLYTGDINFSSPEAKKKYQERATRMIKATKMETESKAGGSC